MYAVRKRRIQKEKTIKENVKDLWGCEKTVAQQDAEMIPASCTGRRRTRVYRHWD